MSDSQGFYIQLDNPEKDTNGKIKADFGNIKEKISYIKVLAKVNDDANKEFLLYKPLIVQDEEVEPDEIKPSENLINLEYDLENNRYIGKAVNAYKIQRYSLNFKNVNNIPEYIKFELSLLILSTFKLLISVLLISNSSLVFSYISANSS